MQTAFLYVEDEALSREIMSKLLVRLGYSDLTIFEDSTDFLTRVESLNPSPNVIFLDIHVNPLNGFDMLKMLRAHQILGSKTIIALTASVMNEEIAQLRKAGFDGALAKPLDFDMFPSLIDKILAGEKVWFIT